MKAIKKKEFEAFLLESFKGGSSERELRLSDEEVNQLQLKFPQAKLTVMEESDTSGKSWYVVKL
ncbi:hypothetical protein [Virgibacillus ainsalahensis]